MQKDNKRKYPYQLLIVEAFIYIFTILIFLFINKSLFFTNGFIDNKNMMSAYIPIFVFSFIGLSLFLYFDYVYNYLKFKNIFLYLGIAIFLLSLIPSISLPSTVVLLNNSTITITMSQRVYGVLYGFALGIMPYLFFYVWPRRIRFKKYIELALFIFILVVFFGFVFSLFKDFNNYVYTFKHGLSDMSHPVASLFFHKNIYGRILFIGICSTIYLTIYSKNNLWLLFLIPFVFSIVFTFAKMPMFLSILVILFYFLFRLICFVKSNKDNLIIFLLILLFVVILSIVFSLFIARSETGVLLKIKNIFITIYESAKKTLSSRFIIWDCAFKLLKPVQYVFGFGFTFFGNALHVVYTNDPRCPEETSHIWTAHNSYIEMIGQGGIVYLFINIFFLVFIVYACIKNYKYNKTLSIMNILVIFIILIQGMTDAIMFFGEGDNLFFTVLISLPTLSEFYNRFDKDEMKNRQEIIEQANKIKNVKFKSNILMLNKKRIMFEQKFILSDDLINIKNNQKHSKI